ncbi:SGNH hydrolase-type esterase domain-containing protein [Clohesyomyces aquaticus]|uniref:SGNH hydrolase-type esterase domain-containing protein n=1 Tax=Clohesyomyces aquaticus TaxID=1231657 RepID=A0A1Y1ZJN5_9PLEO|nr:SGNH hydrolase-type esterase domain-containing protein [Clohesyomyces aquaticus]
MVYILQICSVLALASIAIGAPNEKRAPTVYLAGDSTMAENGGGSGTQGWGHYLQYSLSAPVSNKAVAGRSARSYTVENRFQTLIDTVKSSDIVIIEFGHNDGGSLSSSDNGRTDCPGAGDETCKSTYNGQAVTVLTFPKYLVNAGQALVAKGAKVIFSSQTPNNPWEGGSFSYGPSRFTTYAQSAAKQVGANAMFVDHGQYTANIFKTLGKSKVDSFFPNDHTHTSPAGADTISRAFVKAVLCADGGVLSGLVKNSTASVEGACI